jgi:hypothetical protein
MLKLYSPLLDENSKSNILLYVYVYAFVFVCAEGCGSARMHTHVCVHLCTCMCFLISNNYTILRHYGSYVSNEIN